MELYITRTQPTDGRPCVRGTVAPMLPYKGHAYKFSPQSSFLGLCLRDTMKALRSSYSPTAWLLTQTSGKGKGVTSDTFSPTARQHIANLLGPRQSLSSAAKWLDGHTHSGSSREHSLQILVPRLHDGHTHGSHACSLHQYSEVIQFS